MASFIFSLRRRSVRRAHCSERVPPVVTTLCCKTKQLICHVGAVIADEVGESVKWVGVERGEDGKIEVNHRPAESGARCHDTFHAQLAPAPGCTNIQKHILSRHVMRSEPLSRNTL